MITDNIQPLNPGAFQRNLGRGGKRFLTVHGTTTSWQRLITRLCLHGPVCPQIPGSIHQELRTDCYVSHMSARNIEPDWEKGY